ncbi:UNVERIFIED_CONTAM: hypothetical protein PYX00_011604 [Menopon gallinae]|uniref:AAA+ ATPase domain-containing protein n=1 Tax=Menopon gallinae TaxID=328185 RepID=A0AAW2H894_9NEOP
MEAVKVRERESRMLAEHLRAFMDDGHGSVVYISGVPGSGKTYTVQKVLCSMLPDHVYVNCAEVGGRRSRVYRLIYEGIRCAKKKRGGYLESISLHLAECRELHCIFIDEIDMLMNRKQDILYNIFDLPYTRDSKLMILAVSNTMNLPEKFFDPKRGSVELATKRIGAISGDVRKLLNVIERAKESPKKDITIHDVDETMQAMYKPLYYMFLQSLSVHQKLVLFVLGTDSSAKTTDVYHRLKMRCGLRGLRTPDFFGFMDVLHTLHACQILELRRNASEVRLVLLPQEIHNALRSDKEYSAF